MANDGTVKIGTELDDSGFKSGLSKLGSVASGALKGTVAAVGSVATAASGAVAGLLALESATEEYRVAQGKLNTAFEAAGYGPETAAQAYNDFFAILGDSDTATEASQLLAKLADSQEDLSTWTRIAAGVNGTFGDSLPIEGLIEASNETAKVGTVTGVLADALNWAGISEDEFNAKLAECSDESERNQLIMDTLSTTYDEASDAFYRNNEALVAAREAQAQMDSALAELGGAVSDVKTRMIGEFLPSISQVTSGLAGMLTGTEGAKEQFSSGIGSLIDSAVERLPEFLDFGVQIITSIVEGLISNLPAIIEAVPQIVTSIREAIVELYPTIMDSGAEILMQIANGILGAIPDMLEALPDVIVSLLDFFVENFPKIADAGGDLLAELISGIIGAIPELVAALPEIINAIINGIGALMSGIVEIGADIVRGIWEGILSMADWITEKVKGFFGGIVDSVKGLLGIHSPSTVFRDQVGKNIGLGVAKGIEDSEDEAVKAAKELAESVYDESKSWVDKQIEYQNYGLREQLEVWREIQNQFIKESQQWADAEEEILDLREQIMEENIALEEEYQQALQNRAKEIFDTYSLFDEIPERESVSGEQLVQNLQDQIDSIENFYDKVSVLAERPGVGEALVTEIRNMGPEAIDELEALLSLSDEKLSEYAALYEEKQALANQIATAELSDLREETSSEIQKNLDALEGIYESDSPDVGKALTDGMSEGILSGMETVVNSAVSVAKAAVEAARKEMANFIPTASASVSASNASMTPVSATTPRFSAENAIASAAGMMAMSQLAGSGREVVFTLNGTELARAIIPDIRAVESQSPAIVSD